MVKEIRHTGIVVTDMSKALRFYRDLLGISKVIFDSVVQTGYHSQLTALEGARIHVVMLKADGNCVELLQYLSHPRSAPRQVESCDIGCSHVAFTVEALDELYVKMLSHGVQFNCPPLTDPKGYAKVTYCHDFDGTIVELVEVLDETKKAYAD